MGCRVDTRGLFFPGSACSIPVHARRLANTTFFQTAGGTRPALRASQVSRLCRWSSPAYGGSGAQPPDGRRANVGRVWRIRKGAALFCRMNTSSFAQHPVGPPRFLGGHRKGPPPLQFERRCGRFAGGGPATSADGFDVSLPYIIRFRSCLADWLWPTTSRISCRTGSTLAR
jgi:hypothetical protein